MTRFYSELGAKRMHELGYASAKDFAEKKAELIYGKLPKVADAPKQIIKRR